LLQKLEQINPGDIALYLHTSGTTSKPKGVPLSHYNLVSSVKNIVATYDLTKLDKGLLVMVRQPVITKKNIIRTL
jgi:long-subunit acyl-CoA synthetase (AMP-forming)